MLRLNSGHQLGAKPLNPLNLLIGSFFFEKSFLGPHLVAKPIRDFQEILCAEDVGPSLPMDC